MPLGRKGEKKIPDRVNGIKIKTPWPPTSNTHKEQRERKSRPSHFCSYSSESPPHEKTKSRKKGKEKERKEPEKTQKGKETHAQNTTQTTTKHTGEHPHTTHVYENKQKWKMSELCEFSGQKPEIWIGEIWKWVEWLWSDITPERVEIGGWGVKEWHLEHERPRRLVQKLARTHKNSQS